MRQLKARFLAYLNKNFMKCIFNPYLYLIHIYSNMLHSITYFIKQELITLLFFLSKKVPDNCVFKKCIKGSAVSQMAIVFWFWSLSIPGNLIQVSPLKHANSDETEVWWTKGESPPNFAIFPVSAGNLLRGKSYLSICNCNFLSKHL